jgi:WD40 repeat protein
MIRDLSLSPGPEEEYLIALTDINLIYRIKMEKSPDDLEEPKFEQISTHSHESEITAMDICVRKPLIVTCGKDKYIRIWNYEENKQELCKYI